MDKMSKCNFCSLANGRGNAKIVFEDQYVCCFLDIDPISDGHVLIVPKAHFLDVDELDENTAKSIMKAAGRISKLLKKIFNPDGISIMQNGGIFNDVGHYHMHIFCRYKNDGFGWIFPSQEPKFELQHTLRKLLEGMSTLT